jgi:hypothetical protein
MQHGKVMTVTLPCFFGLGVVAAAAASKSPSKSARLPMM